MSFLDHCLDDSLPAASLSEVSSALPQRTLKIPPITECLMEQTRVWLEKNPIPHGVSMTDQGHYVLNILIPPLATPESLCKSVCQLIHSFNTNDFGCVLLSRPYFDPSGNDYIGK